MRNFLTLTALIAGLHSSHAQVGIGTTVPDSSAALDITASNKGILIPRVTFLTRPATPANGLMIYQLDSSAGFYYYGGSGWNKISTSPADTLNANMYTNGKTITGDSIYGIHLKENGALYADGTYTGDVEATYHASSDPYVLWLPQKAAFRAGMVSGNQWDGINLASYSAAFGRDTRASGESSFAAGYNTIASNTACLAANEGSVASGYASVAMGYYAHTNARRGSFVFADCSNYPNGSNGGARNGFDAAGNNSFNVRASGGYYLYADSTATEAKGLFLKNGSLGLGTKTPASTLHVTGSMSVKRTAVTATYTAGSADYLLAVTTTNGVTINLPAASVSLAGRCYIIKAETTGAPNITVDANASETIDGATTKTINTAAGILRIYCDGNNWWTM